MLDNYQIVSLSNFNVMQIKPLDGYDRILPMDRRWVVTQAPVDPALPERDLKLHGLQEIIWKCFAILYLLVKMMSITFSIFSARPWASELNHATYPSTRDYVYMYLHFSRRLCPPLPSGTCWLWLWPVPGRGWASPWGCRPLALGWTSRGTWGRQGGSHIEMRNLDSIAWKWLTQLNIAIMIMEAGKSNYLTPNGAETPLGSRECTSFFPCEIITTAETV